jgi:Spy/CpxP family protein refolding chaperone
MQLSIDKLTALTAVAALGAAGLFAQATLAPRHAQHRGPMGPRMAAALNLTDAQKAQTTTIFQQARQTAKPVRQQLMATRQSLRAAVQAGNTTQIQQLSTTEGTELGRLAAIHSSAFAQVYKTLTPEQQQKLATIQAARHSRRHAPASQATGA